MTAEMIDQSTSHETIYQAVMRTSLRNPDSTEKVLAIVPDEPSARTLAELTGCSRVSQLGNLVPSRPPKFTSAQKANRARAKKLLEKLYAPDCTPDSLFNDSGIDFGKYQQGAHFSDVIVTFHKKPYANTSAEHHVKLIDTQVWIGCLRKLSNTVLDRKDEGLLFTPAVFDPREDTEGYRRKEHFVLSTFMVLDFDGGSVSPEVFEDIFWSKAKKGSKTSFIMCNSFSRSPEQPNKFRAIILYKRPALSLGEHEAVFDWVEQRLSEAGHPREVSGLDRNCRSGVQPFWLPCTNRAHPESHFFWQRGTKTKELERCALDPERIASRTSAMDRAGTRHASNSGAIDAAISQLRSMTDGRRGVFFKIGLLYALKGRARTEVEGALREVAGADERLRAKIPSVIQSLRSCGRLKS